MERDRALNIAPFDLFAYVLLQNRIFYEPLNICRLGIKIARQDTTKTPFFQQNLLKTGWNLVGRQQVDADEGKLA